MTKGSHLIVFPPNPDTLFFKASYKRSHLSDLQERAALKHLPIKSGLFPRIFLSSFGRRGSLSLSSVTFHSLCSHLCHKSFLNSE